MTRLAIDNYLAAYVRRRRRSAAATAAGWAVAGVTGWTIIACLFDRFLKLPASIRAVALTVAMVGTLAIVGRPFALWLRRRFDPVAAAAAVERQHPAFAHRLVTAASPAGSDDLRSAVEGEVVDQIAALGPPRVRRTPVVVAWSSAAVTVVAWGVLWAWPWLDLPQLTHRLIRPTAPIPAVTTTRLAVEPGDAAVVEGEPVAVVADVVRLPPSGTVTLHTSDDAGHTWADQPMAAEGTRFAAPLGAADRDLLYRVSAGDAVSPTYALHVRRVPGLVAFRLTFNYPPDLHRPPASATDAAGVIAAPAGTVVTVDVVATVPLRSAVLTVGPDRLDTAATADPCVRRATLAVPRDARIAVELTSTDGVPGTGPRSARVHVLSDPAVPPALQDQQRAYRAAVGLKPATRR